MTAAPHMNGRADLDPVDPADLDAMLVGAADEEPFDLGALELPDQYWDEVYAYRLVEDAKSLALARLSRKANSAVGNHDEANRLGAIERSLNISLNQVKRDHPRAIPLARQIAAQEVAKTRQQRAETLP